MKKLKSVQAACLQAMSVLACAASIPTALAQSGLQANASDTPEIIVTASRSEQVLQTAPVGATIITRAQIESAGVVDANEAIRKIGGVAARSDLNGGREYVLDLRGFGSTANENTVVLIDGIRVSENEQTAARLSGVSASSIERIEILRGGAGVMWGEGATSGVINIILRKNAKAGTSGAVSAAVESFIGREGSAHLSIGDEKNSYELDARSLSNNGYRHNSRFTHDTASLGFNRLDGNLTTRVRLHHDSAMNRWPGAVNFTVFANNPKQTNNPNDWGANQDTKLSGGIDYKMGAWIASVDAGLKKRNVNAFSGGAQGNTTTDSTQLSPKLTYKGMVGATALNATIGLDVNLWKYKNDRAFSNAGFVFVNRDGNQSNRAFFAMSDWLIGSQTRLVAGYRTETIAKSAVDTGFAANYSVNNKVQANELALNRTLSHGLDVYGRLAKSYRVANIDDYTGTNPAIALRPQISNDKELGVKYRTGGTHVTARYFLQNTTDEIMLNQTTFQNINIDPTKRSGIELQGSMDVNRAVIVSGTLQTMKAVFEGGSNAGKHIPLVNEQAVTARGAYKIDAKQSVELAARLLGTSYFSDDPSNTCGKKIPSSRLYDAQYRWRDKGFEFSLAAINLTNQSTYNFAFSCAAGSLYPEPGRTLRASLKYNF